MKHSSIINLPVPQVIVACGHKCYTQIGWYIIDFSTRKEFKSYFQDALFDLRFENYHGDIYIVDEDDERVDEDNNEPILAQMLFLNQKEDFTLMRQYPITTECGITKIRKSEFSVLFRIDELITDAVIKKTLNAQRLFYLPEEVDSAIKPECSALLPMYLSKLNLKTNIEEFMLNICVYTGDEEEKEEPYIVSMFLDMELYLGGKDESTIYWPGGLFPNNTSYEVYKNAFIWFIKEWEDFANCEVQLNVEWDYIDDPTKEPKIIAFKNSIREEVNRLKNKK